MKKLFRFFAKRHILATIFTFMMLTLGLYRTTQIKRDAQPRVDFAKIVITTFYPGASPEDVELNVTNKIEDEVKAIRGIDEIESVSRENFSSIDVSIDPDAGDIDQVKQEIRDAVSRVNDLPDEVPEAPKITEIKTTAFPILEVGLSGDVDYAELREQARILEKGLKRVNGVSKIDRFGWRAREIKIEVEPGKVKSYQLPLYEITNSIRARNIRSTAGSFESYTDEKSLVTLSEFDEPLDVGDVIVRSTFEGVKIRVKDLAIVKDGFEEERVISRMNGKQAISFLITKQEDADIISTVDRIKEYIKEHEKRLPNGIEVEYAYDYSQFIRKSFNVIRNNGLVGLLLVVIILTVFLSFRLSVWVALGVPVSLLGAIFFLPMFDVYLDSITLSAMIIVIGIIVDDAIIVSENIAKKRSQGLTPLNSAVEGVNEVFLPVLTTVITTFIAFAPMFFLKGVIGDFVFSVPLIITLTLTISLIESTFALPAHLAKSWTTCKPKQQKRMEITWFNPIRDFYGRFMKSVIKFRWLIFILFTFILIGTVFFAGRYMKFVLFPKDAAEQIKVNIQLPAGSSLQKTSDKVMNIEKIIEDLPDGEIESYATRIGASSTNSAGESENIALIELYLAPVQSRKLTVDDLIDSMKIKSDTLDGFSRISYAVQTFGPPVGDPISISIVGSNDSLRASLTDSVFTLLGSIEGVTSLERNDTQGKKQILVKLDHDKIALLGMSVADITQTLRTAFDGQIVTSVRYDEEDVDFRLIFPKNARSSKKYLENLLVPNARGRLIPLSKVASCQTRPGKVDVRHLEGERSILIKGDVDPEIITSSEVADTTKAHFGTLNKYPGIRILAGGEAEETSKSIQNLFMTLIIAVIGIYFLLVVLFNSWTQPFLVMIAIPFGIAGVIVAFKLHGEPLGFLAVLGLIGLSGVVVNDSLILVDHINRLRIRKPDDDVYKLIASGTADRLRAVTITTITTVAGLMPLAYGIGGSDPFNAPMALALGWGLLFATPLTLLLVPCLYGIGYDLSKIFKTDKTCEVM